MYTVLRSILIFSTISSAQHLQLNEKFDSRISQIIGGSDCVIAEYPYFVVLDLSDEHEDERYSCAGTILSDRYILTAAHCCNKSFGGYVMTNPVPQNYGRLQLWSYRQKVPIQSYLNHYEYNAKSFEYDFCIITLKGTLDEGYEAVRLANSTILKEMFDDDQANVLLMGYGDHYETTGYSGDDSKRSFQCLRINISASGLCNSALKNDIVFCTMQSLHKQQSAAPGDSGGPAIYKNVQVGVISNGIIGYNTYIGRVDAVLSWIQEQSDGSATFPEFYAILIGGIFSILLRIVIVK